MPPPPPEPQQPQPLPPWDRKDCFKERKHDRFPPSPTTTPAPFQGGSRWRDSNYMSPRDFSRWGSAADFRRPPGHGKQGGWHLFAEESAHGSRSSDKMLEDESCRPRGDGKHGRNGRENRGSFNQREWKGHSWDASNGSSNAPGRPQLHDVNSSNLRSVDDTLTSPSYPNPDFVNTWDQLHQKDRHNSKIGAVNGVGTSPRLEGENSLDWKPLKWTRSGSLCSRGSGLSHSSSSKSMGGVDSHEGKADLQPKSTTPVQSPSGDVAACATSAASFEETTSRKKPRLGWGEGLAKYEKKKVEPDVSVNKDGAAATVSNGDPVNLNSLNLAEKSPGVTGFSDCATPATPSSVACSSSPGVEEKLSGRAVSVENDISNLCGSPCNGPQNHFEGFAFNLEKLDMVSVANLGSSLIDLLQVDDSCSMDSSFVRSTAMNKLLIWKSEISKALEMTESEIDSLESELKRLKSDTGSRCPCPAASSSLPLESNFPCEEQRAAYNSISRPTPLDIDSFRDAVVDGMLLCNGDSEGVHTDGKDEDVDSPGTATSKFVETLSLVKAVSPSEVVNQVKCSGDVDTIRSVNMEVKSLVTETTGEDTGASAACGDSIILMKSSDDASVASDVISHPDGEDKLCNLILASNKELANQVSEEFNKLLPRDQQNIVSGGLGVSFSQNDSIIKQKFSMRKRSLRFKERVLTLKFKAFQYLWKEDMRLLSIRKYRAKSQKKCELSLRTVNGGYQKHRSSIRSRFSSPAGYLSLVPTTEIVNFATKLLSESQVKLFRDSLKMPALVLDRREKLASRFISSNGLVEDPCAVEKERTMINPWTSEEKEIFMDKLATFGKDFRKIASFLDHKTTADCVEFYYKNHKSDSFEKTKKKQGKSCSNTYMVTSEKRWSRDINAVSLDILGAASVMAAHAESSAGKSASRICIGGRSDSKASLGDDGITERSSSYDILGNERETVAADVLAGICGSLSSEAMSSCITSSADPGDGWREWKCQKVDSVKKRPSASDVTQNIDDETCSDESCGEMDPADWTAEEKSVFVRAISSYGKDFAMISRCIQTKSRDQCKVFFSKARKCLGLDLMHPGRGNFGTPPSDDANGGGSDTEDACVVETSSVLCSDKLGSKMDDDLLLPVVNVDQVESVAGGTVNEQTDLNSAEENNEMGKDCKESEVPETVISNLCQMDGGPKLIVKHDSSVFKDAEKQCDSVHGQKGAVAFVSGEAGRGQVTTLSGGEALNLDPSNSAAVVENKAVSEICSDGFGNNTIVGQELLTEVSLNDKKDETCSADRSCQSDVLESENTSPLGADTSPQSEFSHNTDCLTQVSIEKPSVISLPHENNLPCVNSVLQDSVAIQSKKKLNEDRLSSNLDRQEGGAKQGLKSVGADYHQLIGGNSLLNHVESSQIPSGYPLQIPTKKEMNGDISCRRPSEVRTLSKSDRNITGQYLAPDCYLQKCSTKAHCSVSELPHHSQNALQTSDHPRVNARSLSDTEKPSRNGDVKLFGKILSNSSSSQSSVSSAPESDEKGSHHPSQGSRSSNLKFSGHHSVDGNTSLLKLDRNNYLGLENFPTRSHGLWDGNRIQTGFSSLPDSTILLAKYPAAFSNYPVNSSKMDQQTLQAVGKNSEHSLNSISVFPPREINGNVGMMDYEMYRSRDGTKVPPFAVEMKQRQDLFAEMQRRSGFDAIASLQQQGRAMVGMNVVGRGGILVGGPCTAVSDPVAAIKMHYAKAEQYGGQGGSMIREDESWRGKGDIGR